MANLFAKSHYNEEVFKSDELIQSYYHTLLNYGEIPMHYHNFHELNVVIKGSGKHFVGEKVFDISKGSVFIIPPFIKHGYAFEGNDFVVFHILFRNKFFDKYEQILSLLQGYHIFFEIEPYLRLKENVPEQLPHFSDEKFNELSPSFSLLAQYEQTENISQQKKEFLALFVIAAICENIDYKSVSDTRQQTDLFYIMKSTEYLQNNYGEKIAIDDLRNQARMSRSTFLRVFQKYYGVTPSEYLTNYRIEQSKKLLLETDKSIAEIAINCGFFDSSHFIRIFRTKIGVSPMSFRKTPPAREEK